MKKIVILVFLITAVSCKKNVENISYLEGYWEIAKVESPSGTTKQYSINTVVDYFMLENDSVGFRKKVQPQLNGRYIATNDAQRFTIKKLKNTIELTYNNNLNTWTETITKLTPTELVVKNQNNNVYHYKKFNNIQITE